MGVAVGVFLGAVLAAAPAPGVRVTYLANEGVLVEGGGVRILIDALFRDSMDPYERHSRDVQEQLETGEKPFDGVTLALATHFHLDHWDAGAITRFLRKNPSALFASTEHGTAMMPYDVRERARSLWPASGGTSSLDVAGVKVVAIPLTHRTTQNLGYRVEVGGRTLAHLGDADPSDENFRALAATGPVDLALVPYWWLLLPEGVSFLKATWKPGHVLAFHLGSTEVGVVASHSGVTERGALPRIEAAWPGAWAATRPLESRSY
jgi:L-ascorbate metabolism protein UlaG (beta-lactamase superfamily)